MIEPNSGDSELTIFLAREVMGAAQCVEGSREVRS